MRQILRYFREHPWQRLAVSLSAALAAGAGIALVATPIVTALILLRRMGSEDPLVREDAVLRAMERARESPATVRRLDAALDTDSDLRFATIATVLTECSRTRW